MEAGRICVDGTPRARACLRVLPLEGDVLVAAAQGSWGQASVCSAPLPSGTYRVRLDCPGSAATWAPGPVTVEAGGTVRLRPSP